MAEGELDAEMVAIAKTIIAQRTGSFDPTMTGGGAAISLGLTVSPFILASISSCKASW
jgi:hypothetical protein